MKLGKIVVAVAVVGMWLVLAVAPGVAANGEGAVTAKAAPAPTASQLVDKAKTLYAAHNYEAALKQLQQVKRDDLGLFEKWGYDSLLSKTEKAIPAKAADEKAFAEGREALTKGRFATAGAKLSQAAKSDYLTGEQTSQAKALRVTADDQLAKSNEKATALIGQAKVALKAGKTAEAQKAVDEIKGMDVTLGWWDRRALADVEGQLAQVTKAAKPVEKAPLAVVAAKPVEKASVAVVAAKPVEKAPVAVVAAKPVTVVVVAKPAEMPMPAGAASSEPQMSLFQQANRAEAEDEIKLGSDALAHHEYEKAKIHFARAMKLWPESTKAKEGYNEAVQFTGEREEPLMDVLRENQMLERQRIIADVNELRSDAERKMAVARESGRPEDYENALRPLLEADRIIDVAKVLTVEEQEGLRDRVVALRNQIESQKKVAADQARTKAEKQAQDQEVKRRADDARERQAKIALLWQRAQELRRSNQFGEAIQVLDRLIAVDPTNERARVWREDLLFFEQQDRQVDVRSERENGVVDALTDTEEATIQTGEKVNGEVAYLRYPSAKDWKKLTELRRELLKSLAPEERSVTETKRRLKETIDLDFERTSLDNVLKYITEVKKDLNIVISPDISGGGINLADMLVDLKVKGVAIDQVLSLILGDKLGYKVEPNYLLITTKEKLQQNLPVVTYPVQDLTAIIPDFGNMAPRFSLATSNQSTQGGAGGQPLFAAPTAATPANEPNLGFQELINIIRQNVNPASDPAVAAWSEEGGPASVQFFSGMLIVSQTPTGHKKIVDLLEQLRRERAIMVSVEARFLQVTDQFMNEITLDVDVSFFNRVDSPIAHGFGGGPATGAVTDAAATSPYPTLPGSFPGAGGVVTPQVAQPIVIQNTSSNGAGISTLLPLAGTAFATFGANEGGMVVSGVFLDDIQVGFLLRAIQADLRSQTLSAPRITLFNGQRSYITVGTVITYVADVTPVVGTAAIGWDVTIGAVPVGMSLDVRATVSADRRYVQLDLRPQIADTDIANWRSVPVSGGSFGGGFASATIDLPVVLMQDFQTTVSVPDGGTLLIAGAKKFTEAEAESGVPFLSKIPILKRLFDNRATLRTNSNLLIMVRPKILIQAEEEHRLGYDQF